MHDLYVEGFEPLVDAEELTHRITFDPLVERHCAEISRAEGIVIVHPNWWSQPPAILKGWIDRVMRPGVAYRFADDDVTQSKPIGALVASAVLVVNTSDMPRAVEEKLIGNPLEAIWARGIFALCGVPNVQRVLCAPLRGSSDEQRASWLDEVGKSVQHYFPPK